MYAVGALGKPMPHRPEAEGAVRPENSMAVGFPDAGVGPGGNPDWNPHTKNGLPCVYGQINVYGVTTKSERHKRSYWTRTADGNGIGGRKAPVPYGS